MVNSEFVKTCGSPDESILMFVGSGGVSLPETSAREYYDHCGNVDEEELIRSASVEVQMSYFSCLSD